MTAYLYPYLVGGLLFAAGLLVAARAGQIGLRRGAPVRRLLPLVLGFLWFAGMQGALLLWGR